MVDYNVNSLAEIRVAGLRAVFDALGPVGYAKFVQMYEPGHGDYTKEKYKKPESSREEVLNRIKKVMQKKGISYDTETA